MKTPFDIEQLIQILYLCFVAMLGGLANYLYSIHKGKVFKVTTFMIDILLALLVGYLVATLVPDSWQYKDGAVFISGYASKDILKFLEERGFDIIKTALKITIEEEKNKKK